MGQICDREQSYTCFFSGFRDNSFFPVQQTNQNVTTNLWYTANKTIIKKFNLAVLNKK